VEKVATQIARINHRRDIPRAFTAIKHVPTQIQTEIKSEQLNGVTVHEI